VIFRAPPSGRAVVTAFLTRSGSIEARRLVLQRLRPEDSFEVLVRHMGRYYSHFASRGIDPARWAARHREKVAAEEEFAPVLDALDRVLDRPGIVLDLRGNLGGNEKRGIEVASRFVRDSVLYARVRVRSGARPEDFSTAGVKSVHPRPGVYFSRWVEELPDGESLETRGVPPDRPVEQQGPGDPVLEEGIRVLDAARKDEKRWKSRRRRCLECGPGVRRDPGGKDEGRAGAPQERAAGATTGMVKVIVTVQGKKTAEVSLDKEIVVGRREDTDLCLPYSEVSSRHARLKPSGAGMLICDLGSTNGTYLDGKTKLEAQKEVSIPPGGRVTIGPAILEVEAPPPPPKPAAPPPRPAAPERDPGGHGTMLVGNVDAKSALVEMAMFEASGARLVVAAPDARRVVPVDKMETTVGREGAELTIGHPSVSMAHARIAFQAGGFFVEDLGSSNGTFVDGQRVQGRLPVASQSTVTFGTVACLLLYEDKKAKATDEVPATAIVSHLVGMGKLTQVEADKALKAHLEGRKALGEVLVADGYLDPSDWSEVWRQRMIIRAVAPAVKSKGISPIVWIAIGVVLAGVVVALTRK